MQGFAETLVSVVTVMVVVLSGLALLSVLRFVKLRHRYRQAVIDIENDSQGNVI